MRAWMAAAALVMVGCGGAAGTAIDGQPGPAPLPDGGASSVVSAEPKPGSEAGPAPACSPITCAQVGPSCATWNDECGGTITCHTCVEDAGGWQPIDPPETSAISPDAGVPASPDDAGVVTPAEAGPAPVCASGATMCGQDFRFYRCIGGQWAWQQGSGAASCCQNLPRYTKTTVTSYGVTQDGVVVPSGTGSVVTDSTTGLAWGFADCPENGVNAAAQCACSQLGGRNWRSPTASEADSLVIGPPVTTDGRVFSVCSPEIDTGSFGSFAPLSIYTTTGCLSFSPGAVSTCDAGALPLCVQAP
jgi:hypothetical protein